MTRLFDVANIVLQENNVDIGVSNIMKELCHILDDIIQENSDLAVEFEIQDEYVLSKLLIPQESEIQIWDSHMITTISSFAEKINIQVIDNGIVEITLFIK